MLADLTLKPEAEENSDLGLSIFPEKGECIPVHNELTITQVIEPNRALAEFVFYAD